MANPVSPMHSAASVPRLLECLVVEDQTLVAQLLTGVLRATAGIGSVIMAMTVDEATRAAATAEIHLILLDLKLPDGDGLDVLRVMTARHPDVQCIVLSSAADEFTCPAEWANNVVATIDKTASLDTVRRAIEDVVRQKLGAPFAVRLTDPARLLRPRELEVFRRIGEGMTTRQIADSLGITIHTVNTHRKAIVAKIGAVGADLVRTATLYNQTHALNREMLTERCSPGSMGMGS